jgi:hypothetical protein
MRWLLGLTLVLAGCGDTGGGPVSVPLMGGGSIDARHFITDEGWTIDLDDARIGFGPVYFCATTSADLENCPAAIAEHRGAVTIDALDETTDALGTIEGRAATLRSATWDYGRPFFLSAAVPAPIAGAVDGEHSARFSGIASRDGVSFHFVAALNISATVSGIAAVHGVRTTHTLIDDEDGLIVRFDVPAIIERLDLDALAATAVDGEIRIEEGSAGYTALVQALTSSALPTLEWARPE